ncbi:MAG: hypothetical protein EP330_01195 [Deltaproteobacteria bacterium]|nr:MAG: hypothetical protein EP330_01195 [Deltaproteobacteria bacterium]
MPVAELGDQLLFLTEEGVAAWNPTKGLLWHVALPGFAFDLTISGDDVLVCGHPHSYAYDAVWRISGGTLAGTAELSPLTGRTHIAMLGEDVFLGGLSDCVLVDGSF